MKAERIYTKYELSDKDFKICVKVSKDHVTLVNKNKNYENQFLFKKSKPALIKKFASAMNKAAKLAEEQQ